MDVIRRCLLQGPRARRLRCCARSSAVEQAALPVSTIPFALGLSSIVRGLRSGLPIRLVAALYDTSVAIIEAM